MSVGTAVTSQPGIHQPQAVQQFRGSAEGAAHSRYGGPLVQGKGGGNILNAFDLCLRSLRHTSAGIGG